MSPIRPRAHARSLRPRRLVAGLALALAAPLAGAATVANCNDAGPGSLRDAIANATAGETIDFAGLGCGAIVLGSGALVVSVAELTMQGPGSGALSISGSDASRVFEQAAPGARLILRGLTLSHGHASGDGGCVLAGGDLTLGDVVATGCSAGSTTTALASGGAIAVTGSATLDGGAFDGNRVDGTQRVRGGAIAVGNLLTVTGTSFTNNTAWSHAEGNPNDDIAEGGAIFALGDTHLTDSVISGNTVKSDAYEVFGGGVAVGSHPDDAMASLDVLRGHVHDNTATTQCGVCAPQGGGIAAVGDTRLRDSTVLNNTVYSPGHYGGGGGVRAFHATSLEVTGSVIAGNHAPSAGGGIMGPEQGVVTLDTTLVTGNSSGNEAGLDEGGGGILCLGCAVVLQSSTVSGNSAGANGGGIFIHYGEYAPQATMIIDSTISGNTSAREGGGIMLDGGDASFHNSTIAFNTAASRGAGISAGEYTYQIELDSTIVANNDAAGAAVDVWAFPDTVSGAHNLVTNAGGPAEMPADTITADPLLLPLADNGGATPTHALGAGSPAIDAGSNVLGLVFDQRGEGYLREAGAAADIGAWEQQPDASDLIFADGFDG
ncbi:MAG: choice-of-anchor Q domain-containing protein [Dokdonella sp.]|uniref:choice-of-anchor Q domain-containing protein n=1 Tax=Dokdonella sp. TaxID=2291710 RepID=UPI003F81069E